MATCRTAAEGTPGRMSVRLQKEQLHQKFQRLKAGVAQAADLRLALAWSGIADRQLVREAPPARLTLRTFCSADMSNPPGMPPGGKPGGIPGKLDAWPAMAAVKSFLCPFGVHHPTRMSSLLTDVARPVFRESGCVCGDVEHEWWTDETRLDRELERSGAGRSEVRHFLTGKAPNIAGPG